MSLQVLTQQNDRHLDTIFAHRFFIIGKRYFDSDSTEGFFLKIQLTITHPIIASGKAWCLAVVKPWLTNNDGSCFVLLIWVISVAPVKCVIERKGVHLTHCEWQSLHSYTAVTIVQIIIITNCLFLLLKSFSWRASRLRSHSWPQLPRPYHRPCGYHIEADVKWATYCRRYI